MNHKIVILVLLLAFGAALQSSSQTDRSITGVIADAEKKPFLLATVILSRCNDTAVIKTVFTDADGKFSFSKLSGDSLCVTVTAAGYMPHKSSPITSIQAVEITSLDTIFLRPAATNQEGVVVTAKKPFVEQKLDRMVVNVDALISNAGTTALDVLSKSPGVLVDQNGSISLKGKSGVLILIDNKPTYLSGEDLQNYLSSIPSSQLGQIEIMTNPPARYDAAGNAGVINIKMKRIKTKGFNGSLSLGLLQGRLTASNNSLNLNYRYNKVNAFASIGYGIANNFRDLKINRQFLKTDGSTRSFFNQDNYTRITSGNANIKAGVDYYLSDRTVMGTVLTGLFFNGVENDNNVSYLLNPDGTAYSIVQAVNRKDKKINNKGVNLNIRHQLKDKKQDITFDADYVTYDNSMNQRFINTVNDAGVPPAKEFLDGNLPSGLDIYAGSLNYSNNLKSGWNFESGLKSSFIKTGNRAEYFNIIAGVPQPDYDKSNDFRYRENINAAFANVNKEFGAFALQVGLRLENTVTRGNQLGNLLKPDSAFKFSYTSLFPTVYLSYRLDTLGRHQLGLNYGRRVDRPFYQDLNPFILPFDKYTFYVGNPFLRPAFTNSIELSYTFNNQITAGFSYAKSLNGVNETIDIVDTVYFSRPRNIGSKELKSFSIAAGLNLLKRVSLNFYGEVTHLKAVTQLNSGPLNASGFYGYLNPTLQFMFNRGWAAEWSLVYITNVLVAQIYSRSYWQMNCGLQKTISPKLTAKLNATDLFYSYVNRGDINNLDKTIADFSNRRDSRRVGVTLSYKFGKAISNLKRHETTAAEDEKKRVKN